MNAKLCSMSIILILFASASFAQGFGELGTKAVGFEKPVPGAILDFPRDHGMHPDFRIEWWYVTANLEGADNRKYGVQWTLFRSALKPGQKKGWASPQLWMGHTAITSRTMHSVEEIRARGGIAQAGVEIEPFNAWINDWQMRSIAQPGEDALSQLLLTASGTEFAYKLKLNAKGPLVLHGENGYSIKSNGGHASHYYSQPFYGVTGVLKLPDGDVTVSGSAWLDREWSSQPLAASQKGWDWVSLHFDDGAKLMGFRLRENDDSNYTSATWIAQNGTPITYPDGALTMTPLQTTQINGKNVPTRWRIQLPDQNVNLTLDALNKQSWMNTSFPYWEGPVSISGSNQGRGYLEMTGY
jgi:predicted secreted hydrolase